MSVTLPSKNGSVEQPLTIRAEAKVNIHVQVDADDTSSLKTFTNNLSPGTENMAKLTAIDPTASMKSLRRNIAASEMLAKEDAVPL